MSVYKETHAEAVDRAARGATASGVGPTAGQRTARSEGDAGRQDRRGEEGADTRERLIIHLGDLQRDTCVWQSH